MFQAAIADVAELRPEVEPLQPLFLHLKMMEYRIPRAAKARSAN